MLIEESMASIVEDYFLNVFTLACLMEGNLQEVLRCVEKSVTTKMNEMLLKAFTEMEVIKAIMFVRESNKGPGPDGIQAAFYQHI